MRRLMQRRPGLPCTRRGPPLTSLINGWTSAFALHPQGSTLARVAAAIDGRVCPAPAGVHLTPGGGATGRSRLPCTRRGPPRCSSRAARCMPFALHAQGSTVHGGRLAAAWCVCPARAGVHPDLAVSLLCIVCLPCTRRGPPWQTWALSRSPAFALHAQGSTQLRHRPRDGWHVCPARAGVHLHAGSRTPGTSGLPCTRRGPPLLTPLPMRSI